MQGPFDFSFALGIAVALGFVAGPGVARAFSTESSVRNACHETMTFAAIDASGWPDEQGPPALDETDRRITADVPFRLPPQHRNSWSLSMALGNRHVDLRGHEMSDFVALAREAAKPERQPEHCLRRPGDDGVDGDRAAVEACRDWVLEQVGKALGPAQSINFEARETFEVVLDFRGPIDIDLPRYAFRMGMAMHAIQDGFSHMLRTDDGTRVVHVLNYVDWVQGSRYSEARDGHRHESHLDQCGPDVPADQQQRVDWAAQASAEVLAAVNDPTGGREGRMERVAQALDRWFQYEPGCTVENAYCNSPALVDASSGTCDAAGGAGSGNGAWALLPLAALALLLRRRIAHLAGGAGAALLGVMLLAQPALADEKSLDTEAADEDDSVQVVGGDASQNEIDIVERRTADASDLGDPVKRGFGFNLNLAAGIDDEGAAIALGVRVDVLDWLTLGIDGEYNPWFSLETGQTAPGTANLYLTGIGTWGVVGPVELRTSIHAGGSMLLWDMVGADKYSVGPFFGITPLGVALRAGRHVRVTLDPGGVFFAIPNVEGVPLIHREHRFAVGVRLTP